MILPNANTIQETLKELEWGISLYMTHDTKKRIEEFIKSTLELFFMIEYTIYLKNGIKLLNVRENILITKYINKTFC